MSTELTLTPYRRRSPRRNLGIPTICARRFDGWRANVSAVDTGSVLDLPSRPQSSRLETSSAARASSAVVRGGGVTSTAVFLNESGLLEMFERVRHLAR